MDTSRAIRSFPSFTISNDCVASDPDGENTRDIGFSW